MSAKLREWKFKDDIYQAKIHLFRGPYESYRRLVEDDYGAECSEAEPQGCTTVADCQGSGYQPTHYIIWVPSGNHARALDDINTVSHEALHVTFFVLLDRGCKPKIDNHEAFTYYHGWLMQQCMQRLRS